MGLSLSHFLLLWVCHFRPSPTPLAPASPPRGPPGQGLLRGPVCRGRNRAAEEGAAHSRRERLAERDRPGRGSGGGEGGQERAGRRAEAATAALA